MVRELDGVVARLVVHEVSHDELRRAQSEAETLTSLLIHDMKGPLTGLIGLAEVVASELTGPQQADVKMIEQQGRRLTVPPGIQREEVTAALALLPALLQGNRGGIRHKLTVTEWNGRPARSPAAPELAMLQWGDAPQPVKAGRKIGRNDPCYCGSGKKYKFCCGR